MLEELLIYGAVEGAIYALLAVGFSLVYGVGGVLNLAHGAFYVISGYLVLWLIPYPFQGQYIAYVIAVVITLFLVTLIGALSYQFLIKPLLQSHVGVVIVTFALAFFFEQFIRVVEYLRRGMITTQLLPSLAAGSIEFLGVTFHAQLVLAFFGSLVVLSVVSIFITKTKIGKSIRAVSQDREAATLMGINANRVLMLTVALSAFLASVAGTLYLPASMLASYVGWSVLLIAYSVVVLGGMGSIPGSILGAFVMSYASNFCIFVLQSETFAGLVPLIVILVVLVLRPRGLLGKKET